MTVATAQISESLQVLIDSRLDTIERMLLGRLSRQDRLAIVREVESQIHELLQERDTEELTREDVLGVLARLDPPEAYLPEETAGRPRSVAATVPARVSQRAPKTNDKLGRASGLLGLGSAGLLLLLPVCWLVAVALNSEVVLFVLGGGTIVLVLIATIVGLVLGIVARKSGTWAIVGIVTSALAQVLALAVIAIVFTLLRT
jgi:hypothetical protein